MLYREPKLLKVGKRNGNDTYPTTVSVLYREPKLLKAKIAGIFWNFRHVSVLYREPKLLKGVVIVLVPVPASAVSVLYREPKLLKGRLRVQCAISSRSVSVLYREPKLLKALPPRTPAHCGRFQCSTVSRNC